MKFKDTMDSAATVEQISIIKKGTERQTRQHFVSP